jgi:transposase
MHNVSMAKKKGRNNKQNKSKRHSQSAKLQARYERRCRAIDAIGEGATIEEVARVMGVSPRTVFYWLGRYRNGGYHALREGQRSGRKRKLDADLMRWLYRAITKHDPRQYDFPFHLWTLGLIRILLKRKFGIELSKSAVSRLLRHLGLSAQRPIYKSYKRNPQAMKEYLERTFPGLLAQARRRGAAIYFVDEAAVRSDAHRGTTWGKIGQTPEVEDSGDRFSLKMISAVSPRGDMKFQFLAGRMQGTRFVQFLLKLRADAGRPIIVITDNASYHGSGPVRKYVRESQGQVVVEYLPAYCPHLNPDEQVWNHAKARLAKRFVATKEEFKAALLSIMLSIQRSTDLILSFFQLPDTKYAAYPA